MLRLRNNHAAISAQRETPFPNYVKPRIVTRFTHKCLGALATLLSPALPLLCGPPVSAINVSGCLCNKPERRNQARHDYFNPVTIFSLINCLEEYSFLVCYIMQSGISLPTFQRNVLPPVEQAEHATST